MAVVFVNELLCYICNKYNTAQKGQLKAVLLGFYTETELSDAKDDLFAHAAKLNIDDLPRCIKRAKGDNRARLLAEDILDVYSFLDEQQALDRLPVYVARSLDRVPLVRIEDMELYCVMKKLDDIDKRLNTIETVGVTYEQVTAVVDTVQRVVNKIDESATGAVAIGDGLQMSAHRAAELTDNVEAQQDDNAWNTVVRRTRPKQQEPRVSRAVSTNGHSKPPVTVRVCGTKVAAEGEEGIKAIPRKKVLAAFVGRLQQETTAEELDSYLTNEGMKGVVCRKLKAKPGQKFKTAAFYVSCCVESADLFYKEECWPAGAELRDWVYK